MATWVTDLNHLPDEDDDDAPVAARRQAQFVRDVVEAATSREEDSRWTTAVRCIARKATKRCSGRIVVLDCPEREEAEWECDTCGERGIIKGFASGEHDMSDFHPWGKLVLWGVDEETRELVWEASRYIPEVRAVIARATPHDEISGLLVVEAAVEELDDVYTLVEELTDLTRSRRQRALLDDLRASLSTAMDGF